MKPTPDLHLKPAAPCPKDGATSEVLPQLVLFLEINSPLLLIHGELVFFTISVLSNLFPFLSNAQAKTGPRGALLAPGQDTPPPPRKKREPQEPSAQPVVSQQQ